MSTTCPLVKLTPTETQKIRDLIDKHGKRRALSMLGMRDLCALMTAAAGFDVHRLTAYTIRENLPDTETAQCKS